jgi:hypothetical protein
VEEMMICDWNGLNRHKYSNGQILTADDFTSEQNYFVERLRRHNRNLHGWGVVSGLAVSVQVDESTISISPGVAIDCFGNEIDVGIEMKCAVPKAAGKLFVVIQYQECPTVSVPVLGEPCGEEGSMQSSSRIQEVCHIGIVHTDPSSNHAEIGPGTPGCGSPHPMSIARLIRGVRGWRVILMGRR